MHAPKYGVVDMRRGFLSNLVTDLAAALALPTPVHDAFLFDPSPAFYAACTESVIGIQRAARKVIEHLGLACGTVVVTFVPNLGAAGKIERTGPDWFIEIDAQHKADAKTLGAILAHECCHIVLVERRVRMLGNALDEVNVDLAAMLTGLGALTLNAITDSYEATDQQIRYAHQSFGYLRAHRLEQAYGEICVRLGLSVSAALRPLTSGVVKRGVVAAMLRAGLQRRPLGFAPIGEHVVIACTTLGCATRLRVPVRRGTARCPKCETRRELDGRALETRIVTTPVPLGPRAIPHVRPPSAAATRWRVMPLTTKVSTVIVILAVVGWFAWVGIHAVLDAVHR